MPQTFSKLILSGSANGKNIIVAATATPGTLLHTAVAGTSSMDEIFLYVYNADTIGLELTIEWGGVAVPADHTKVTINPLSGRILITDGKLLQNSLVVRAFAPSAKGNLLVIDGFVHRII